jgi:hypothetical protein
MFEVRIKIWGNEKTYIHNSSYMLHSIIRILRNCSKNDSEGRKSSRLYLKEQKGTDATENSQPKEKDGNSTTLTYSNNTKSPGYLSGAFLYD